MEALMDKFTSRCKSLLFVLSPLRVPADVPADTCSLLDQ